MNSHSEDSAHDSDYDSFDSDGSHDSALDIGRESQPKLKNTKKTRGMTIMKEVINRVNKGHPKYIVEWNVKNQAIGVNGRKLKSFCGVRARLDIPITIKSWNSKRDAATLEKLKDELFSMIQKYFDLDDSRKDFCLMKAGKAHRKFRSILTKWMIDKNGNYKNHPPSRYRKIIRLEDWNAFVLSRQEEAFKKLSRENSNRATNPPFPYRAGVMGYSDIEERQLRDEGKNPTQKSIERHVLWLEARKNKDGVVDHPKTQEVAQKIESISQGVVDYNGPNDLLARALAIEEYPGRVRGVGMGVTQTTLWSSKGQKKEEKRRKQEEQELRQRQLEATVAHLQAQLDELRGIVRPGTEDVPSPNPNSFRDSCNIASNEVNNCYCNLYLPNPLTLVAKGFVCNAEDSTLHNLLIPPNHSRVKVEFVVVNDAPLPIPIDTADMTLLTVNDALGTLVAWPSNLINVKTGRTANSRNVSKSQTTNLVDRMKQVSRRESSSNEIQSQPSQPIAREKHVSQQVVKGKKIESQSHLYEHFISYIKICWTQMTDTDVICATMDLDILGVDQQIELRRDELKEVSDHEMASMGVMHTYMRYLYDNLLIPNQQTQRIKFLCPLQIFLRNPIFRNDMPPETINGLKRLARENKDSVKAYIDGRLSLARESSCDMLFLAPFNVGTHWILLVVDARRNIIFYLDSCHGDPSNYIKMREVFERARSRNVKNLTKWKVIKCPKQPNNVDCGYYVMRFMKDIITHNQMEIPQNYFLGNTGGASFSDDQLMEIKGEWCQYVATLISQNRNSM